MKRTISIFIVALVAIQFALAGDVITQDPSRLPQSARSFLDKYFPSVKISHIKIDSEVLQGKTYEVLLTDRTEVDFDSKGNWKEVDCKQKAIPSELLPTSVREYVKSNFPQEIVTKIERYRGGVEVELGNDYSLKFDRKGRFVSMDD